MKSVALVGFCTTTLPFALQSKADEFWTINHAFKWLEHGEIPRIDRLFEIHKPDWYTRKEIQASVEYTAWLKKPHPFPIYMEEMQPDVPACVRYPIEEVKAMFKHIQRLDGTPINFYTSSFSYLMGLAILEEIPRIEIYGFDMASGTEYEYQMPGGTYMVGFAGGRGLDVVIPKESGMCRAKMYGYEAVPSIITSRMKELKRFYQDKQEEYKSKAAKLREKYNHGELKLQEQFLDADGTEKMYIGASMAIDFLLTKSDYFVSRQSLELVRVQYHKQMEDAKADTNFRHATFNTLREHKQESEKAWIDYINARATMYANLGAEQMTDYLIGECDMKDNSPELLLTILDR
jgi:hypothetical protein